MSDESIPDASEASGEPAGPAEPTTESGDASDTPTSVAPSTDDMPREYGGRKGPDPVRYGDWEKNGRCIDF